MSTISTYEETIRLDTSAYGIVQRADIKGMTRWLPVGSTILDVGCGFGLPSSQASEYFTVKACDIPDYAGRDPDFCETIMRARNIDFKWSKPDRLPYADNEFDGAMLYAVIEHVPEKVALLRECSRVVKPGGKIFMFRAVNKIAFAEKAAKWCKLYTHGTDVVALKEMKKVFQDAGLTLNKWGYQGWLPENRLPKYTTHFINTILTKIPFVRLLSHDFYFICTAQ